MPTSHTLRTAQIVKQENQQQRRKGCCHEGEVEPADQAEIGIPGVGLVDLPLEREYAHPVQPRRGIALAKRRKGKVGWGRIGEVKGRVGRSAPVLLPRERALAFPRVLFQQHGDGRTLVTHLGNAEAGGCCRKQQ
ncbi:MAG: hypothetical protein EB125_04805, partial [Betaproteobacteria bacterium]|nr:hypothetical protein [Betaproteobacteria bacterium]